MRPGETDPPWVAAITIFALWIAGLVAEILWF